MRTQIEIASVTAMNAHAGQKRRGGASYITHPMDVARRVAHLGEEHQCVAMLHDVLEDTKVEAEHLLLAGVRPSIVSRVERLTKAEGESYDDYINGLATDPVCRDVKFADILSNLSDAPTPKQIHKYGHALMLLSQHFQSADAKRGEDKDA